MIAAIDAPVIVALIGAGTSLLVALYSGFESRRTSVRLAELETEREEARARRDYEYDARKRLYAECEPLLFQAAELAMLARSRVTSLARTARGGDLLPDGRGWLADQGYYFKSTTYMLLAPATTFRLLQRRLTVIDLGLEPRLRIQYELLKLLFLSFNEDFELAHHPPELPYEPDKTDPGEPLREERLASEPQRYARQGVYRGVLDVVVEALIVADGREREGSEDGRTRERVMTFGEFLRDWERPDSDLCGVSETLFELLSGFHPQRKPVLWRVLLAQYMLHTVLLLDDPLGKPLPEPSAEELKAFDWRRPGSDQATDEEVDAQALTAHAYVSAKLTALASRLQAPTAA